MATSAAFRALGAVITIFFLVSSPPVIRSWGLTRLLHPHDSRVSLHLTLAGCGAYGAMPVNCTAPVACSDDRACDRQICTLFRDPSTTLLLAYLDEPCA